jgi:hypothetical protein
MENFLRTDVTENSEYLRNLHQQEKVFTKIYINKRK